MTVTTERLLRSEPFLRRIHDVAVAARSGFQDEVDRLLELGRNEFGFEIGAVSSVEGDKLVILHAAGSDRMTAGTVLETCDAFCGEVVRRGHPMAIEDAAKSEWRDHPGYCQSGITSYFGAPILVGGGLRGSVCFLGWEKRSAPFNETDYELLRLLAQRVESVLERMEVAQALRESEERFRATFEHANVGIAHIGTDGAWLRVNPRLCEILGYDAEELRSLTFQQITHPEDLDLNVELLQGTLAGQTDKFSLQKRYLHKHGHIVWAHLTARLLRTPTGEPDHLISVIEDITEQKQAEQDRRRFEERAQEAQKLESLGAMAGGIAHDFNNLLTAMLGHASIAREAVSKESRLYHTLHQIEVAAQRAADLTNQLLAYAGKGRFIVKTVDVATIIDEMQDLLKAALSKSARLSWRRPDKPMLTQGDVTQLRQVVMNLMTNASEALERRSGTIGVTIEHATVGSEESDAGWTIPPEPGDYVALHIADDGCGMDDETRRRLFEPCFSRKFIGRGLGLSAVLGIVRGHQGAIHVESAVGRGTKVTVMLPAATRDPRSELASRRAKETWQGNGMALVVDDEEGVRQVAGSMLLHLGFEVSTVTNGWEAIEAVRKQGDVLRVVLLDVTMPGISGDEAFRRIHELRPDLPVILMSGYNEQQVTSSLAGKGLAGFLKKPFTVESFSERLRDALEN